MSARINPPEDPEEWEQAKQLRDAGEAIASILKIVPDLKCPVCSTQVFSLVDDYPGQVRTGAIQYSFPEAEPKTVTLLVSITCENCGYLISFSEGTLKDKAGFK